jgi:hypothetical protein
LKAVKNYVFECARQQKLYYVSNTPLVTLEGSVMLLAAVISKSTAGCTLSNPDVGCFTSCLSLVEKELNLHWKVNAPSDEYSSGSVDFALQGLDIGSLAVGSYVAFGPADPTVKFKSLMAGADVAVVGFETSSSVRVWSTPKPYILQKKNRNTKSPAYRPTNQCVRRLQWIATFATTYRAQQLLLVVPQRLKEHALTLCGGASIGIPAQPRQLSKQ